MKNNYKATNGLVRYSSFPPKWNLITFLPEKRITNGLHVLESTVQRPKVMVNMHSAVHLMLLAGRQNSACIAQSKRINMLKQVVAF